MKRPAAVVIGAGVMGCSAAWHLLETGRVDVTLIDAGTVGSGTSSAGAGFVALWAAGYNPDFAEPELEMERYGLSFYLNLHEETGGRIGYRKNGNLTLALTESGLEAAERQVQHPDAPAGSRELTPSQVEKMTSVIRRQHIAGAVWQPAGVQVEADRAVQAIAAAVQDRGGRIFEGVQAKGLVSRSGEITAVDTDSGRFEANAVIVACGAWSNGLLATAGVGLPLVRMLATRVISGPAGVPDNLPLVLIQEKPMWLREARAGYTWGVLSCYRPLRPTAASTGTYWEKPVVLGVAQLTTAQKAPLGEIFRGLATTDGDRWVQGVPCYTPDGRMLAGLIPGLSNAVVLGGDNETGLTHGPALGRIGAELALGQEAFVQVDRFALDRFDPQTITDEHAALRAAQSRFPWMRDLSGRV